MDSATISALAALGGAILGGLTSFATTWLSQQSQARAQQLTHKISRREDLYKAFIEEASKSYADALIHNLSDATKLVALYAMVSRMRVMSSNATITAADEAVRTIIKTYGAPNKALTDLHDLADRGEMDVLKAFSESARKELNGLAM
jgi:Cdc6-like AAA superfamily ATPase